VTAGLIAVALLLSACGGGGDDGDEAADSTSTTAPVAVLDSSSTTEATPTSTTVPDNEGDSELSADSVVTTNGLGPLEIGMTLTEAAAALGSPLVEQTPGECSILQPPAGPSGIDVIAMSEVIARIDISNASITTRSGAGVGMSRDELFALFGDKLQATPNASGAGEQIALVPTDAADADRRVIFETDAGDVVVRYRTGRLPEVEPPEPCTHDPADSPQP
jgi:hypothetical protein